MSPEMGSWSQLRDALPITFNLRGRPGLDPGAGHGEERVTGRLEPSAPSAWVPSSPLSGLGLSASAWCLPPCPPNGP